MKISNTNGANIQPAPRMIQASQTPEAVKQEKTPSSSVSLEAKTLSAVNEKMTDISDVDMDKVNQVRLQLSQHGVALDLDKLADAIIDMHRA